MKFKFCRKVANLMGYELFKGEDSALLSTHLKLMINNANIDLVIDVGANEGQFAQSIREIQFKGEIHSFEPVEKTFDVVRELSNSDPNWFCYKLAMGAETETKQINVAKSSVFSSLHTPSSFGKKRFRGAAMTSKETINMTTLDERFGSKRFQQNRLLLKTDTQGFDLQVLKGARGILNQVKVIICELSLQPIYNDIPNYTEMLEFLAEAGFQPTGFYPISRKKDDASLIEMDCVLVNTNLNLN